MFDRQLRQLKERTLAPVADECRRVHPTTITLLGGVVGVTASIVPLIAAPQFGFVFWALNRLLDGLDGTVARRFSKTSDFGGYVDILVDYLVYATVPIGLSFALGINRHAPALILMLAIFYINSASWMMLSSILEKRNRGAHASGEMTTITMPTGIIEGTETIVMYSAFFLFPQHLTLWFLIFAALTAVTIIQRLIWASHHLD